MKIKKQILQVAAVIVVILTGIALFPSLRHMVKPVHAAAPVFDRFERSDIVVVTMECSYPQGQTGGPVVAAANQSSDGSYTLPVAQGDCTNGLQSLYEQGLDLQSFGVVSQTSQTFADTSAGATSITTAYTTGQYLQWILIGRHRSM
jgi:hypothetical protein